MPALLSNPPEKDLVTLMRRETQVFPGPFVDRLEGQLVTAGKQYLDHARENFLLRDRDFSILYRKGHGVFVSPEAAAWPGEVALYLDGSVYAAAACLNGLFPFHASAIAVGEGVVAFTGPAGAGKSTLLAGLSALGWPMFCDDTLIAQVGDSGELACLPGHKRLKLWPDALEMTGARSTGIVSSTYPKHFASPAGGDVARILPLRALVVLAEGEECSLVPVSAGERIALLDDDHHTRLIYEDAAGFTQADKFRLLARIAGRLAIHRFTRPKDPARFGETTGFFAERLEGLAQ